MTIRVTIKNEDVRENHTIIVTEKDTNNGTFINKIRLNPKESIERHVYPGVQIIIEEDQ